MNNSVKRKNLQWLDTLKVSATPNFEECRLMLEREIPLLNDFADTEQDNIWHGEGNVEIHTNMVLSEVYKLLNSDASHISGTKRQALILGALLHDIAKPITTKQRELNGELRVVAPKHEEFGRNYLALRLPELGLCHEATSLVLGLVGYHQTPKLLVIKNRNKQDYFKLAANADVELLYWLEVADMKGRVCEDLSSQLGYLEEFKMFCEDYALWSNTVPWELNSEKIQIKENDISQTYLNNLAYSQWLNGKIFSLEEAISTTYEKVNDHPRLVVCCGLSGSGKSTWIENNVPDYRLVSLDEIREEINGKRDCQKSRGQVLQLAKARLKESLAKRQDVVWDATNLRRDFRDAICLISNNYGALITMVVFQIGYKQIYKNNLDRKHSVPESVIGKQLDSLQWPEFEEAHRLWIVGEKGVCLSTAGSFSLDESGHPTF